MPDHLLDRIERYYDTVPRVNADVEQVGPFTLFLSRGGWSYYARPTLGGTGAFTADDVTRVRATQRARGVPETLEWVEQVTPTLASAVQDAGVDVVRYPLLVLDDGRPPATVLPEGTSVQVLDGDDPTLGLTQAAIGLGFSHGGTARGAAGPRERDALAAVTEASAWDRMRANIRSGHVVLVAAVDAAGPVGGGSHSPRGQVTELTGIATLPTARRRGIGAAVTAALTAHARARGATVVFLSAGSDDIARVYAKVGFRRVATACTTA